MKISPARAKAFIAQPDQAIKAVLLYGPDRGEVRETFEKLTAAIVDDPSDPFRVANLTTKQLLDDPALLADEAAALALGGGRRVVRLTDATDKLRDILARFLEDPKGDSLVLISAGELTNKSKLRLLFEGAANGAAIAAYGDEGADLGSLVRHTLGSLGLKVEPDALSYLSANLGGDRMVTRRELEKLAVYMTGYEMITLADAVAAVGDSAGLSYDDLAFAAADGDQATAQRVLAKLLGEGISPVAILRALSRHFQRLHLAVGHMAGGKSVEAAMKSLWPRVFYKLESRFRNQLRTWSPSRLASALDLLTTAEADCKTTGFPDREICGRVLIQITRAGAARR